MRPASYPILVLAALCLAAGQALSERGHEPATGTRAFSIDGKRFVVEETGADNRRVFERELARRGIDEPQLPRDVASVLELRTIEPLREALPAAPASLLPEGLAPDHVLRLETATGPVEVAFGRLARRDREILGRLDSRGWTCTETDAREGVRAVASRTKGKEASVVLLDRSEGRFLAIRRTVR